MWWHSKSTFFPSDIEFWIGVNEIMLEENIPTLILLTITITVKFT